MDVRILGEFEVRQNGSVVDLGPPKAKALLAVLLLSAGEVVPTDRLIDRIWGDDPPRTAAHSVQTYVSGLRRALGNDGICIETRPPGYRLLVDPDRIDAQRFEQLAVTGGSHLWSDDVEAAIETLEKAMEVWTGSPLPDFAYSEFAQSEIRRLEKLRTAALGDLAEAYLASGNWQSALHVADERAIAEPLDERSRALLMRALTAAGRQAEALRAYSAYRELVGEELGIEPSEELRRLEERILLQDPTLLSRRRTESLAGNLPLETTSFVGRDDDVTRIGSLLAGSRLVTLLGFGGVGKSRLALHVAHELAGGFPDGVWRIDFGGQTNPDHVAEIAAGALGALLARNNSTAQNLGEALAGRNTLLVFDNCESIAAGVAELAESLLRRASGLTLLATSREPLEVQGEVLWRVNPLDSPNPTTSLSSSDELMRYPSVRLFCERAGAVDPGFELDSESAVHVARVCRLLDGIPLAIELAAARVRHMTIGEIERGLDDRFGLLVGGGRMVPRRHRALEATLDWSFRHLSPLEQEVFSRLGIFLLEFPPEAAELVCSGEGIEPADVRDALEHLIDRSLVVREVRRGRTRCRLLNTMAEYLLENTSSRNTFHELGFFLSLVQSTDPALRGPEEQMWAALLAGDAATARRCLRHAAYSFREDHGAYLAGVAAALTTQTGRVGFIGGINPQPVGPAEPDESDYRRTRTLIGRFRDGFVAGVADTNPSVVVDPVFLTDAADVRTAFRTPAAGREQATRLYEAGCDVIAHAAGLSGDRIFEAARRMSEDSGIHRWGIGADIDEYLSHEEPLRPHILASVVKEVPMDVYSAIKRAVIGGRADQAPKFDLANHGVRLATTGGALDRHRDILETTRLRVIEGKIETGSQAIEP